MARQALSEPNGTSKIPMAWLGCLMDIEHSIIVRKKSAQTPNPNDWFFPLMAISESACIFWRVDVQETADGKWFCTPDLCPNNMPILHAVWDLTSWECRMIAWRSPIGQMSCGKLTKAHFQASGIRAEIVSNDLPLMQAAAKNGFWHLDVSLVCRLAGVAGIEIPPGGTNFEKLLVVTMAVLQVPENDALTYLGNRLSVKTGSGAGIEDFLKLDDADLCLDEADRKEFVHEKERLEASSDVCPEFKAAWVAKRRAIAKAKAEAHAAAGPAGGRKGKGKGAKAKAKANALIRLPPDIIDQKDAKVLAPPNSYIWRANHGHAWCGHYKPYARVSKSWHLYGGNRPALIYVLRELWTQYLEFSGLHCPADCTVAGLFDESALGLLEA
jgi:hypothetical protein